MDVLKQPVPASEQASWITDGRVEFVFEIPAGELLGGLENLNDAACDAFGNGYLQDLGFTVVGFKEEGSSSYVNGTLLIQVNAMLDPDDIEEN